MTNYINYHTNRNTYARIKQYQKATSALQAKLNEFFIVRERYDHGTMSEPDVVKFITQYLEREYMDAPTLTLVYNTIRDAGLWDLIPAKYQPVEELYAPDNMVNEGKQLVWSIRTCLTLLPALFAFNVLKVNVPDISQQAPYLVVIALLTFAAYLVMSGWSFGINTNQQISDTPQITLHHVPVFSERFKAAQKSNTLKVDKTKHGRDEKPIGSMTEWFA